nr:MAG TPA: hypothetical protein [Caudoviricetes sp.]
MLEALFLDPENGMNVVHKEKRSEGRTFTFEYVKNKVKKLGLKSCIVEFYFDGVLVEKTYY